MPCLHCHTEKKGPYVLEHVGPTMAGMTGGPSSHLPPAARLVEPEALIRSQVYQLCLECHDPIEGGTLGSQPPSFHDVMSPALSQLHDLPRGDSRLEPVAASC